MRAQPPCSVVTMFSTSGEPLAHLFMTGLPYISAQSGGGGTVLDLLQRDRMQCIQDFCDWRRHGVKTCWCLGGDGSHLSF